MLYLILLYIYLTVLCCWAGLLLYTLFERIPAGKEDPVRQRPLIIYLLSGLLLLASLGQWLVLFVPLDRYALLITLGIMMLLSLLLRKKLCAAAGLLLQQGSALFIPPIPPPSRLTLQQQSPAVRSLFLLCCLMALYMILVLNGGPSIMDDTESYHIQSIKWMQEYGTVPGIANLHHRFGYNSSWFVSIALLVPVLQRSDHYLALNGLLSFWFFHYLLQKIFTAFSTGSPAQKGHTAWAGILVLLFALLCWPIIRGNAATANYDFITTCCLVVLFMETYSALPSPLPVEGILWPCFLFTVRMVNAPVLIYTLILLFRLQRDNRQKLIPYLLAGGFLIIPFIIRNVLLSGYPFYPIYQIAPFHVDWKVSRPLLAKVAEFNTHFNRGDLDTPASDRLSFPGWVPSWYRDQPLYNKLLLDLALTCWAILLIKWKKIRKDLPSHYKALMYVMVLQICSWLYVAPDPRFVNGVLLSSLFAGALALPFKLSARNGRKLGFVLFVGLSGFFFIYTTRKVITDPLYSNWLTPRPLPLPVSHPVTIDHIKLFIPDKVLDNWNPRCYDLPLPCLYIVNPFLHARGTSIRDGFRTDKEVQPQKEEYMFQ